MNDASLIINFVDNKSKRSCNWHLKQFAREGSLMLPQKPDDYIRLFKERGFGMQYSEKIDRVYFPTEQGWKSFLDFIDVLHRAEPFQSRATYNDVYQNFNSAFSRMLSAGVLPENLDDLIHYLPNEFKREMTVRSERVFSKLRGIQYDANFLLSIGHCWIGTYDLIIFDTVLANNHKSTTDTIESIENVYKGDTPIITGSCNPGTSDCVIRENTFQCELALSILGILLNMTRENAFQKLWLLQRVDRPEQGLSKQITFSFAWNESIESPTILSFSMKFTDQLFEVNKEKIDMWHNDLFLKDLNKIVTEQPNLQVDLGERLINSLLYFRQSTMQSTPEMQISTLWICVESFFTAGNDKIVDANLNGLLAMTISLLNKDFWPNGAKSYDELKCVFSKHYSYRSKTFHHGKRGHVSNADVQQFSIVVCNLIIGITLMIRRGFKTSDSLLASSKQYIAAIKNNPLEG